ncbi:MAG: hypothetical protein SGPRY_010628 [Prymnesium sp.]
MSVLELLLGSLLKDRLKALLHHSSFENAAFNLRQGEISLNDVSLRPEAMGSHGLPIRVSSATVGSLQLLLPWRTSPPSPLVLRLNHLCVIAVLIDKGMHSTTDDGDETGGELARKLALLARLERGRVEQGRVQRGSQERPKGGEPAPFDLRRALDAALRELHLSCSDLSLDLRSETDETVDVLKFRLSSLTANCLRKQSLPPLLSLCLPRALSQLFSRCAPPLPDELKCEWQVEVAGGVTFTPGMEGKHASPTELLGEVRLRADAEMRIDWPTPEREMPRVQIEVGVEISRVRLHLEESMLEWLAWLGRETV